MKEAEMKKIAGWLADCIFEFDAKRVSVMAGVADLCSRFPIYEG
jgi:glycine/serine hydroxymethyltransferase